MRATTPRLIVFLLAATIAALPAAAGDPPDSDWNQYLGANRDGLSPDTGLLKKWPSSGPPLAWKRTGLGESFSSVSFAGDRLFTMGDLGGSCNLFALNVSDGKTAWTAKIGRPGGKRNPGPRSTPATDGESVYALGQYGDLVCVAADTGKERWRKNLTAFGGRVPGWNYSESPLLDGDRIVVTPGGSRGAVLALNKKTGRIVWQSRGFNDRAHYTSLVPAEIGGVRQYLCLTGNSVAGIGAEDGKVLWRGNRRGKTAICSSPVYGDGILFVSSAYGVGCNGFRITGSGGRFKAEEIYSGNQIQSHHGGMVRVGDHVYGLGQRGLKCIELKTGRVVWENRSVGKGSIAYADGHLVVRSERSRRGRGGTIALVEATPEGYREKGRFDQPGLSGEPTWAYPVVFGGKLYIRDQGLLLCYDVKAK